MKTFSKWHSIQTKLTVTFLLILLPLVLVSIFANDYSQRILDEQIRERARGALRTTLEYVDQLTKNMDQQTLLIGSNPNIVNQWKGVDNPLSPDRLYDLRSVQQQLTALTNVNGAVREAYIVHGESGNGVSTVQGGIKWPGVRQEVWFQRTVDAQGGLVVYVPAAGGPRSGYLADNTIYYIRLLDVLSDEKEPNVLILAVDKLSFQKMIQHLQTSDRMNITLYFNDSFVLETNPNAARLRPEQPISIREESGFWSIALEQPKAEVFQLSRRLQQFTYLITMVSVLLAVWIAWLVYANIARPLHQLSGAFKQFSSGHLAVQVAHKRKDEFGFVMNAFNRMAATQRKMIEDDYEKELRLAKAEFSTLQSQINPHFLYNTLDSIYSVASQKRIPEISEMVINLARFFRVSLGKGRTAFTLEETVRHLMYYIRVQQIRMDHFTVDISLAEETRDTSVLKLLLQPLVENAIVHGLAPSAQEGRLAIRSALTEGQVQIEIEDNGVGMPESTLLDIRRELDAITSHSYRHAQESPATHYFGLKNVKARMKLYYGDAADVLLDSRQGAGTRVTLILPQTKEEQP